MAPSPDKRLERVRRNNRWALAALLFPLFFTAVVAVGIVLMFKRQMAFFRPAPSGGETEIAVPIVADRDPALIERPDERTALPRIPDPR